MGRNFSTIFSGFCAFFKRLFFLVIVDRAIVMQESAMELRPGLVVRMHSMLGLMAVVNGKTGVLKHLNQSVWVVVLEEPCVIGLHKKHELRVHPKYLTGLPQPPMLFSQKLTVALLVQRHEMEASGACCEWSGILFRAYERLRGNGA